jgi:hypothetical protein
LSKACVEKQAAVGFEPTHNGFANRPPDSLTNHNQSTCDFQQKNLASCLALLAEKYPDLALVVEHWPNLPEHIKAAVKALVEIQPKPNGHTADCGDR